MTQLQKDKETINQFLQAGLHFGHQTNKWNPKNKKYIFGEKNGIHIIDVTKTVDYLNEALNFLHDASTKGDILFVGTKKQAQDLVRDAARSTGMPYVISRWPGGLLTNFNSVRVRIKKIDEILKGFNEGIENRTKKELVLMKKELKKLERLYGGVRVLERKPAAIFIVDSHYEKNARDEANKLGIPIVAIHDTNSDPDKVGKYIIPGNDDAKRSIELILNFVKQAIVARTGMPDEIDFDKIDEEIQNMAVKVPSENTSDVAGVAEPQVVRVRMTDIRPDSKTQNNQPTSDRNQNRPNRNFAPRGERKPYNPANKKPAQHTAAPKEDKKTK